MPDKTAEIVNINEIVCRRTQLSIVKSFVPEYIDLTASEIKSADAHIKVCKNCRDFYEFVFKECLKAGLAQGNIIQFPKNRDD